MWLGDLGSVDLTLQLNDDSDPLELTVSPIQATLIHLFQSKDILTLDEIQGLLECQNAEFIRQNISFWIGKGILVENYPDNFRLSANEPIKQEDVYNSHVTCHLSSSASTEQEQREMQVFWTYIVGMLTNLGPSPAARIHSMLAMFVQAPQKYDRSLEELEEFLQRQTATGKLDCSAGKYSIKL